MVDRVILPPFMRALEAHIYMRGHAYRQGGDEYLVLAYNADLEEGVELLNRFCERVRGIPLPKSEKLAVSVGVVEVGPDCHLTGREVEAAAATVKKIAKERGKDRVAYYTDSWFETPNAEG